MAGKLFKYLSELIIIIAGISISLFFDELAEDLKKDKLEIYYLQSLLENLQEDSTRLKGKLNFINKIDSASDVLLKYFLENPAPEHSLTSIINSQTTLLQHSVFASNKSVYEELKSTGYFIAIKNRDLKNDVFNYYGTTENVMQNDVSADNVITYFVYQNIIGNLSLSNLAKAEKANYRFLLQNVNVSNVDFPKPNNVSKNEMVNAILIRKGINASQKFEYLNLSKLNASLINSIRKELSVR